MKNLNFEFKSVSDEGTFEGLLSPYGVEDAVSDVILRGAYSKNLAEQGPTRPLLWQHDTTQPIGQLILEDRPQGLWCKGVLELGLAEAQKAYLCIRSKIISGLSIGFICVKDSVRDGVRYISEIRLMEGSIVTFPCAETAQIVSVKSELGRFPAGRKELAREARASLKTASAILEMLDEDTNSTARCIALMDGIKSLIRTGRL